MKYFSTKYISAIYSILLAYVVGNGHITVDGRENGQEVGRFSWEFVEDDS